MKRQLQDSTVWVIHRGSWPPSSSLQHFSRSRDKSRKGGNLRHFVGVHFFSGDCDLQYLMVCLDRGIAFAFGSQFLLTARHISEPFPDISEKKSIVGAWLTDADDEMEEGSALSTSISTLASQSERQNKTQFRRLAFGLRDRLPYSKDNTLQLLCSSPAGRCWYQLQWQALDWEGKCVLPVRYIGLLLWTQLAKTQQKTSETLMPSQKEVTIG